jgi:tRNA G18 (ribose-2'-O)-methylase SpoU
MHIAIENWEHDFNIGSIVRTANAFNVGAVHIIGRRKWNKRGAMMTDVYQHVYHHYTLDEFNAYRLGRAKLRDELRAQAIISRGARHGCVHAADSRSSEHARDSAPAASSDALAHDKHASELAPIMGEFPLIGIDILPGVSQPLERAKLPEQCILLFGSEGQGLTPQALELAQASSGAILHITQHGSTRSINAGHAAAVAMYAWSLQWR